MQARTQKWLALIIWKPFINFASCISTHFTLTDSCSTVLCSVLHTVCSLTRNLVPKPHLPLSPPRLNIIAGEI